MAGKQKGKDDERYLFPEMLRVIADLKPHFVVGENVPGILRIAAADVVQSLEREGYECVLFDFEAAAVGAHHRRERIAFVAHRNDYGPSAAEISCSPYEGGNLRTEGQKQTGKFEGLCTAGDREIVAHARSQRLQGSEQPGTYTGIITGWKERTPWATSECGSVFNTECKGFEECNGERVGQPEEYAQPEPADRKNVRRWGNGCGTKWPAEPDVGRVAHGVPNRVDRIKALGNAVVPAQFYPIFRAIAEELRGGA